MAPRPGDPFGRPPRPQGHPVPPSAGGLFGRPAPPMPPHPPRHPMPPRPPRGSLAGDILIGGMLAGLGELLEESMDTSAADYDSNTEYASQSVKLPSECPFCGAPVVSSVCDYCGRNTAKN